MSELFQTEESLSPELQWLSEAKRAGMTTTETGLSNPSDKWSAGLIKRRETLNGYLAYGATEFEAANAVCFESGLFPTFDQWKLERAKQ